jgi:N-acyl-D-amino-acid deacylase
MLDLIIEGGEVVDGSGNHRFRADVGIMGDKIVSVGNLKQEPARKKKSAQGLIVAPGFIDVHTHDDQLLLAPQLGPHPKISQGVTTVITGNCGISLAPLVSSSPPAPLNLLGQHNWRFDTFSEYLAALDVARPALNAACLVGHSTLRVKHMSDLNRPATPKEVGLIANDLASALNAGAFGLSTGLYYPTASAATAEEVIAIADPMRHNRGILTMHIRDEGNTITSALKEALFIGEQLNVPIVLSHHKLVGKANHGRSTETLALIDAAAKKQQVCLDCYPYNASSTMLVPSRVAQSDRVLVTWSDADPTAAGRSIEDLAIERGQSQEEVAQSLQPGGAIYFAMSDADVDNIVSHPLAMIGSDGLAHDVQPHPRLWGTFPRVLGHYVRNRRLLALETAVHKMTGLSASRFGLKNRGRVAPGFFADLVVFNENEISDVATYEAPTQPSLGIQTVYINGKLVAENGITLELHAGSVLRNDVYRTP